MLVLVMLEKLCAAIEPDPTRKKKVFYMMVQELDRVGMLARRVPTSNASYRMIENAFYGQCSTPHPTPHTRVCRWSVVGGRWSTTGEGGWVPGWGGGAVWWDGRSRDLVCWGSPWTPDPRAQQVKRTT